MKRIFGILISICLSSCGVAVQNTSIHVYEPTPSYSKDFVPIPKPIERSFQEGISIQEFPLFEREWPNDEYQAAQEIDTHNNCGIKESRSNQDFSISEESGQLKVKQRSALIYEYPVSYATEYHPWTFCTWDNNWMIETHGTVIINGQILNRELGYDEIFAWHMLGNKQIFFVGKDQKYQILFDGKLIPFQYDEISHHPCWDCENIHTNGVKTWIHARRGKAWFMVIISLN